ncbi:hypothetical protein C8N43_1201 [Litoreibacter ponti]|uniref:Nuclease n=1 Tax=Litoreibacter ponti TaxID=1510457 RepID=A0A2T6BKH0_9RHOB|nr:hypothetical protein [Litoreibacter ponti]PTX56542.1 hypothetical protein C8N43_1201 [Litoreibacter ponti]
MKVLRFHILLAIACVLLTAKAAVACSLDATIHYVDQPIDVSEDGSFVEAGDRPNHVVSGLKIKAIGRGLTAQTILSGTPCPPMSEYLILADCNDGDLLRLYGTYNRKDRLAIEKSIAAYREQHGRDPFIAPYFPRSGLKVAHLVSPNGPMEFTKNVSIASIEAMARTHDLEYTRQVSVQLDAMAERNRFNPFAGCSIHYPESQMAQRAPFTR